MLHPSYAILYVTDVVASCGFYRPLLGLEPVEQSETFGLFVLPSGFKLGLWRRDGVEPRTDAVAGGSELAVALADAEQLEQCWKDCQRPHIRVLQQPTDMDFGKTFVIADPDGHRLRVFLPAFG